MTAETLPVPTTQAEFEEALHDKERMKAVWSDGPDGWKDFVQGYARASLETAVGDPSELALQMQEQVQLGMQNFLRDQASQGFAPSGARLASATPPKGMASRKARALAMSRIRDADAAAAHAALFSDRAVGAAQAIDESRYASNLKNFLYATIKGESAARQRGDDAEIGNLRDFKAALHNAWNGLRNAMGERVPSEGGFLVPETLRSEVLMVALEDEVIKPRATIIPMDSLRVPIPSIDDTSHTSNVFGGVAAAWTEEGASLSLSAPSFSRVLLEARKLTAYTAIPNELLQDSVTPLDVWFDTFFPQAIAFFHDVAFISGTGVGEPEGLTVAPGAVTVTGTSGHHIRFANVASMLSRMWPASLKRAIWLAAPDAIPELAQMAVSADGGTTTVAPPVFLPGMSAVDSAPGGYDGRNFTLFGRPGFVSEKVPALAGSTPGSLMLVDPKYYLIGDRQAMQVASSTEYLFAQDEVAYRVIERLDGRFWLRSPITPNNGSANTLSPLVKLDTTS